jgi:hypothetical protein
MLSIYQHARQVIIWLGVGSSDTQSVRSYVDGAQQAGVLRKWDLEKHVAISASWNHPKSKDEKLTDLQEISELDIAVLRHGEATRVKICKIHSQAIISGLHNFLTRPWYNRLWVQQEVWAAKKIQMVCGSCTFDWDVLRASAKAFGSLLRTIDHSFRNPFEGFNSITEVSQARNTETERNAMNLLRLLQRTSSSECTDPRDKVYVIVGMTKIRHGPRNAPETVESRSGAQFPN